MPAQSEDVRKMREEIDRMEKSAKKNGDTVNQLTQAYEKLSKRIATNADAGGAQSSAMGKLSQRHALLTRYIREETEKFKSEFTALDQLGKVRDNLIEANHELAATEQALRDQRVKTIAGWMESMEKSGGAHSNIGGNIMRAKKALDDFKQGTNETAEALGLAGAPGKAAAAGLLIFGAALSDMITRFNEAAKMIESFGGVAFASVKGVASWTKTLTALRPMTMALNVSTEDISKSTKGLIDSYAMSSTQASKLHMTMEGYSKAVAGSMVKAIAMGRVTGMTTDETTRLIATFGVLGENLTQSDMLLAKTAATAQQLGMTMSQFSEAIAKVGSANLFAGRTSDETSGMLYQFGQSILKNFNEPLLNAGNRAAVAARAVQSLADAAKNLELPQMFAFGLAMKGFQGSMDDALRSVNKMNKVEIVKEAFKGITEMVEPDQQLMAKYMMASTMGINNFNDRMALALGNFDALERQGATQITGQNKTVDTSKRLLEAALAQVSKLDTLIKVVKGTPGALVTGGVGGLWGSVTGGAARRQVMPSLGGGAAVPSSP